MVAIENIKAGDKVVATNPDTGITEKKTVPETYIRKVTELVHLSINGEEILTTHDHPFYVYKKGYINAGQLKTTDKLVNAAGSIVAIDQIQFEASEGPTCVYNFKVEDYHTYYVGTNCILVHNADYEIELSRSEYPESAKHIEEAVADGQTEELTLDRKMAKPNRKASLKGTDTVPGMDRDEYPFAMTREGGAGADIKHIPSSDNRGSGSYLRWQLDKIPDGKTFKIKIID